MLDILTAIPNERVIEYRKAALKIYKAFFWYVAGDACYARGLQGEARCFCVFRHLARSTGRETDSCEANTSWIMRAIKRLPCLSLLADSVVHSAIHERF